MPPLVSVRDVTLTYGRGEAGVLAVQNLTFDIQKGEFVAVVGPSGCGKSSLMKLVTGLLPPTSGQIFVDGAEVTRPIRGVGMAFQNSTLLPWRSTLDNVMLPFEIVKPHKRRLRWERSKYVAQAEALLAMVGLSQFGAKYPWELSGGMQQRANLCRALVHQPDLLMLDEPFGALDAFTREELWAVMQTLWLEKGFTAVLVTHDLREAVYLSNRVVVISHRPGRVVYEAKVDLPRPRALETTFEAKFIDIVRDLRERISRELTT
ncbi:MAG TPA: ABC transporter ATP-binding protein [Pseudolabrys sp.]|jgi:NitT/TauT family transport system ATP-binding protein|nr:ABC transporter ATP-binding protein [Pseudolabrys sp.]